MSNKLKMLRYFCAVFALLIAYSISVTAQNTAFTYQGRFTDSTVVQPTNGTYTMKFRLYDALTGGNQSGSEQTSSVTVTNGIFTTTLDFANGPFAAGQTLWLEIQVGAVTLAPRQKIESVPYSVRTISAGSADTLSSICSPCVTSAQIVSLDGSKIDGTVLSAANATTANSATTATSSSTAINVTGIVAIANGGTGSSVKNFIDLAPSSPQLASTANDVIDMKLVGTQTLGQSGTNDLLSLSASGTYNILGSNQTRDQERFRVDNTGGFTGFGEIDMGTIPAEGAGSRFMWMPYKGATRGGYVNGTQWDDANIGYYSTAFGRNARASGDFGFAAGQDVVAANSNSVAMGQFCTATGYASVALGYYAHTNARSGSFVFSDFSVLDDGNSSTDESFRAANSQSFNVRATGGYILRTNTSTSTGLRMSGPASGTNSEYFGSFIWSDRSSDAVISPTATNQTIFRSSGGYWLYSNSGLTAGVTLSPGAGAWSTISDRNKKENFADVDSRKVLQGVLSLPISSWNYKAQDSSIRHIGPMAQDFASIFKVGENNTTISTIDPDGIAFAAIQGLYAELGDRDAKIEQQQQQLNAFQQQLDRQQSMIDQLKTLICAGNPNADVCRQVK
jgi:hypothetical protein